MSAASQIRAVIEISVSVLRLRRVTCKLLPIRV